MFGPSREQLIKRNVSLAEQLEVANATIRNNKQTHALDIERLDQNSRLKIERIEADHKIALKEKEAEITHYKDDELKKMGEKVTAAEKKQAVLEKENEMLIKITDLNGDVIDIKELVRDLIGKLPEVNLQNLTITQAALPSGK
jgi:hypothetical protein